MERRKLYFRAKGWPPSVVGPAGPFLDKGPCFDDSSIFRRQSEVLGVGGRVGEESVFEVIEI